MKVIKFGPSVFLFQENLFKKFKLNFILQKNSVSQITVSFLFSFILYLKNVFKTEAKLTD
jgi:hypothetical protein